MSWIHLEYVIFRHADKDSAVSDGIPSDIRIALRQPQKTTACGNSSAPASNGNHSRKRWLRMAATAAFYRGKIKLKFLPIIFVNKMYDYCVTSNGHRGELEIWNFIRFLSLPRTTSTSSWLAPVFSGCDGHVKELSSGGRIGWTRARQRWQGMTRYDKGPSAASLTWNTVVVVVPFPPQRNGTLQGRMNRNDHLGGAPNSFNFIKSFPRCCPTIARTPVYLHHSHLVLSRTSLRVGMAPTTLYMGIKRNVCAISWSSSFPSVWQVSQLFMNRMWCVAGAEWSCWNINVGT